MEDLKIIEIKPCLLTVETAKKTFELNVRGSVYQASDSERDGIKQIYEMQNTKDKTKNDVETVKSLITKGKLVPAENQNKVLEEFSMVHLKGNIQVLNPVDEDLLVTHLNGMADTIKYSLKHLIVCDGDIRPKLQGKSLNC